MIFIYQKKSLLENKEINNILLAIAGAETPIERIKYLIILLKTVFY